MSKTAPRRTRPVVPKRPPTAESIARAQFIRRSIIHVLLVIILIGGFGWLVSVLQQSIASRPQAQRPTIVFANQPGWMSDLVASNLAESFRPATAASVFDREALIDVNGRLKANPWVSKVRQVRRVFGQSAGDTIEVDCEFRTPTALVYDVGSQHYWFVDDKGVKLPEWFNEGHLRQILLTADKKVNMRIIDGVRNPPPPKAGQLWPGDDLLAGIQLAKELQGKPFAEDIIRIRVDNYAGRKDPREAHLVLVTQNNTEVRWGQPIGSTGAFVEVTPARKFEAMRQIVGKYGRVDAGQPWIDVRFDTVTYPASASTKESAQAEGWR